ncbi:polysaccharide deacetylase family protein [Candidatus Pelagibacter sp.]|jgi:peptidoglycan/xylan/chitin deacetylase (PgdA/CDA1 family)|nr:polysaccharide deacetylase family protein [Candidatus Pelagibacter sp.]
MLKKLIKNVIFFTFGNFIFLFLRFLLKKNCLYVVNYHATYPKYEDNFKKQLSFYKDHFEIVDENILISEKNNFNSSKPKILITFDDGHITNYTSAARILDSFNIKASFFIPINVIDRKTEDKISEENKILSKYYNILSNLKEDTINCYPRLTMNWSNIIDLDKRGHFIGSHGYNHIRLSEDLDDYQLDKEISQSKKTIEKKLNKKINSFCWIIGDKKSYTKKASDKIRTSNYKLSFMTCAKPFDKNQDLFQIHRFNIEDYFSLPRVYFVLCGIYELMYFKKRNFVNNVTK